MQLKKQQARDWASFDHLRPKSHQAPGEPGDPGNKLLARSRCNLKKGASLPTARFDEHMVRAKRLWIEFDEWSRTTTIAAQRAAAAVKATGRSL